MRVLLSSFRPHLLAALGALLLITSPAAAQQPAPAKPKPPASTCAAPGASSQVFLPFGDPAFYYLAPNGSFEKSAWSGGTVAAGNEPFFIGGRGHKRSMSVAGPVSSPSMCIAFDAPTIRFFAQRTSGDAPSTLDVTAIVPVSGRDVAVPLLPVASPSGDWVLTAPTPILANLTNAADVVGTLDGRAATRVRFVLTPSPGSTWRVDDFYVDPYRRH
jgi:hypothetical protein